jgi:hypothetical protein
MRLSMASLRMARILRPLIGVIVAYAVAAQALLVAVGGFPLAAQAHDGVTGFELCLHDAQDAQQSPAGNPDRSGCTHCIFCFAGSHHAVIGATAAVVHRVDIEIPAAPSAADTSPRPNRPAHTIASPRGPPTEA